MTNFTYHATFENGEKFKISNTNLYNAQSKCIRYMERKNITKCEIKSETKAIHYIVKDGSSHWNYDGYSFGSVREYE